MFGLLQHKSFFLNLFTAFKCLIFVASGTLVAVGHFTSTHFWQYVKAVKLKCNESTNIIVVILFTFLIFWKLYCRFFFKSSFSKRKAKSTIVSNLASCYLPSDQKFWATDVQSLQICCYFLLLSLWISNNLQLLIPGSILFWNIKLKKTLPKPFFENFFIPYWGID